MKTAQQKGSPAEGEMFKHFGHCLRTFRELSGESQQSIARKAGVGKSQLSKYEAGHELPKFASLERILTVLKVSLLEFVYLLSIFQRRFDLLQGVEAQLLLQPESSDPFFKSQEGTAIRGLFDQLLRVFRASVEARFPQIPQDQEPQA